MIDWQKLFAWLREAAKKIDYLYGRIRSKI